MDFLFTSSTTCLYSSCVYITDGTYLADAEIRATPEDSMVVRYYMRGRVYKVIPWT